MAGTIAPPNYSKIYFCDMGTPQQLMEPSPPLVTTNSALHVEQEYLLPVSFAKFSYLLTLYLTIIIARFHYIVNETDQLLFSTFRRAFARVSVRCWFKFMG
jgi:hypothetical protein